MENNNFELPKDYIDNWLFADKKDLSEEEKEKQFAEALKEIKWSVLRRKLSNKFDVKVEENEIVDRIKSKAHNMISQYGLGQEYLQEVMKRMMQDEREVQQIALELETEKMFKAMVRNLFI